LKDRGAKGEITYCVLSKKNRVGSFSREIEQKAQPSKGKMVQHPQLLSVVLAVLL